MANNIKNYQDPFKIEEFMRDFWYPNRRSLPGFFSIQRDNFPKYDIVKVSDGQYRIDIALAGYSKNELDVFVQDDNKLVIRGNQEEVEDPEMVYHQGIARRSFEKSFHLDKDTSVVKADHVDGVLSIYLQKDEPKGESVKKIDINSGRSSGEVKNVFLTEGEKEHK